MLSFITCFFCDCCHFPWAQCITTSMKEKKKMISSSCIYLLYAIARNWDSWVTNDSSGPVNLRRSGLAFLHGQLCYNSYNMPQLVGFVFFYFCFSLSSHNYRMSPNFFCILCNVLFSSISDCLTSFLWNCQLLSFAHFILLTGLFYSKDYSISK